MWALFLIRRLYLSSLWEALYMTFFNHVEFLAFNYSKIWFIPCYRLQIQQSSFRESSSCLTCFPEKLKKVASLKNAV